MGLLNKMCLCKDLYVKTSEQVNILLICHCKGLKINNGVLKMPQGCSAYLISSYISAFSTIYTIKFMVYVVVVVEAGLHPSR